MGPMYAVVCLNVGMEVEKMHTKILNVWADFGLVKQTAKIYSRKSGTSLSARAHSCRSIIINDRFSQDLKKIVFHV